jgi:cysteinyl-tRNA synthetase
VEPLLIHNTMSGQKEVFTPYDAQKVGVYVCGPTVYDMSHIGHARAYVAFDTVVRFLRARYGAKHVLYVRNYTDIDDKIIHKAQQCGGACEEVSERFIAAFKEDMAALDVLPADVEPKVTQHVPHIIQLIQQLVEKNVAYASGGDVFFSVEAFESYGCLAKRSLEDMEAGARVDISEHKKNPMDFVLWKKAKPGEPVWESPWGAGRPGWHIECSAMSACYLGASFDIHGGGKDLVFPHHENEIAQSEAASSQKLAQVWMHNGFVNIDNEKMSKSLGNFFTIRDVLKTYHPQVLRFYLLCTHYRSPIQFSDQALKEAEARLQYMYETLQRLEHRMKHVEKGHAVGYAQPWVPCVYERFEEAMRDDFNTPRVLGDLSEVFKWLNETLVKPVLSAEEIHSLDVVEQALRSISGVLGVFHHDPSAFLTQLEHMRVEHKGVDVQRVQALIQERQKARAAKDFAKADAVRAQLSAMGVVIKDGPSGTQWEVVR